MACPMCKIVWWRVRCCVSQATLQYLFAGVHFDRFDTKTVRRWPKGLPTASRKVFLLSSCRFPKYLFHEWANKARGKVYSSYTFGRYRSVVRSIPDRK